ncbi:MaoC family dehydratase [Chloroflexota bacterium]
MATEEIRKAIEGVLEPSVVEIEKGLIKRYAEAIEDPNPLWQDEVFAAGTEYGGIIAPPMLLCTALLASVPLREDLVPGLHHGVDGGGRWEFYHPIFPGDIITSKPCLADISEKQGSMGKMILVKFEVTHENQNGLIVAKSQGLSINY